MEFEIKKITEPSVIKSNKDTCLLERDEKYGLISDESNGPLGQQVNLRYELASELIEVSNNKGDINSILLKVIKSVKNKNDLGDFCTRFIYQVQQLVNLHNKEDLEFLDMIVSQFAGYGGINLKIDFNYIDGLKNMTINFQPPKQQPWQSKGQNIEDLQNKFGNMTIKFPPPKQKPYEYWNFKTLFGMKKGEIILEPFEVNIVPKLEITCAPTEGKDVLLSWDNSDDEVKLLKYKLALIRANLANTVIDTLFQGDDVSPQVIKICKDFSEDEKIRVVWHLEQYRSQLSNYLNSESKYKEILKGIDEFAEYIGLELPFKYANEMTKKNPYSYNVKENKGDKNYPQIKDRKPIQMFNLKELDNNNGQQYQPLNDQLVQRLNTFQSNLIPGQEYIIDGKKMKFMQSFNLDGHVSQQQPIQFNQPGGNRQQQQFFNNQQGYNQQGLGQSINPFQQQPFYNNHQGHYNNDQQRLVQSINYQGNQQQQLPFSQGSIRLNSGELICPVMTPQPMNIPQMQYGPFPQQQFNNQNYYNEQRLGQSMNMMSNQQQQSFMGLGGSFNPYGSTNLSNQNYQEQQPNNNRITINMSPQQLNRMQESINNTQNVPKWPS